MARILVFAGSTRGQSLNKQLAKLAADAAGEAGAQVTIVNLCDHPHAPIHHPGAGTTRPAETEVSR